MDSRDQTIPMSTITTLQPGRPPGKTSGCFQHSMRCYGQRRVLFGSLQFPGQLCGNGHSWIGRFSSTCCHTRGPYSNFGLVSCLNTHPIPSTVKSTELSQIIPELAARVDCIRLTGTSSRASLFVRAATSLKGKISRVVCVFGLTPPGLQPLR